MHVAEQPAEVSDCIKEYGRSPVALLDTEGLLSQHFTAVHAIHVSPKAITALARSRAAVCACPTTERNLGDGVVPVDSYFAEGVPVSLGTDSQVQIDLLEDARELEYHLRLQRTERNVLAPADDGDRVCSCEEVIRMCDGKWCKRVLVSMQGVSSSTRRLTSSQLISMIRVSREHRRLDLLS